MVSIIVATAENNVIGKNNQIPWRLKNDLIRLKSLVLGKTVILGRKTYDSLISYYEKSGRVLPARTYVIITHQPGYIPKRSNTLITHSVNEAVKEATKLKQEAFILGGAQIYKQALPYTTRVYMTEVKVSPPGDAYFPELGKEEWVEVTREKHHKNVNHEYDYDFVMFDRLK